jgi:hypothetical protein
MKQGFNRMTQENNGEEFIRLKRALQAFQSARINATYADIKKSAEYAQIGKFFFRKAVCSRGLFFSGHQHEKAAQTP